jgi:isopropylmalate/homocitrate/citramalate synthase
MEPMSRRPWLTDHWAASQHNFDPAIAVAADPVVLHDITVRDGEESADLAFSVEDKVRIAEALARVGVRRMELFLTVPGWLETVRQIMGRRLGMALYVTWHPGRVERALELGVRHIMVWYRIGEVFQRHVLKRSQEELLDEMLGAVRAAREAGAEVNLFMPESTRASLEHIRMAVEGAQKEGASSVTVVDSQGVARPAAITYLVRQIKSWTGLGVEVHCHNDFGLAVANVLAAYEGGADALHCAVNAVGYRAGNAALEEVAMALEVLYGVKTGLRLDQLPELSRLVEEITGLPNGYFKPVVGRGAFSYEQWGATAALAAGGARPYAFPYEPEVVGRSPRLVIGKWSDLGAVVQKLAEFGLTASPEQLQTILHQSQMAGVAHHRPLGDDEFLAIALERGAVPGE